MTAIDELNARVSARLAGDHGASLIGPLEVLPGGHSGLTYRAAVDVSAVVVKAVPPGRPPLGRHDVLRQARVLAALAGSTVPVPRLIAVDDAEPAWFAMSWAKGEAVEPVLDGIVLAPSLPRTRMLAATQVLAELHRVDIVALTSPPVSPADELAKWAAVLRAGPAEFHASGERLAADLATTLPAAEPRALVHGDFRLGNLLFTGTEPSALVDWEIWGVGDPRVDLGYFAVFADHTNFPHLGVEVAELPSETELVEHYAAARGRSVADATWFRALGRFKMAAIMSHNLQRHRAGRHDDPVQEQLPPTILRLTATGMDLVSSARAHR
jgi:aminoglycoside phosphotransferase (APT) family kinase protein